MWVVKCNVGFTPAVNGGILSLIQIVHSELGVKLRGTRLVSL